MEDILDWVMISYPLRTTHHLAAPGNYAANWLDADGLKFWLIKNLAGNPWDINTYDSNHIYHYITENADVSEPGGSHWGDASAFKRALVPVPIMPRVYDPTAPPVTITTGGTNDFVRTIACETDGEPLLHLGAVTAITSGGLTSMAWGGDVGTKPTIINTIYFGTEREQFFYVKGLGLVQWQHANLTSGSPVTGVYAIDQTTGQTTLTAGGCPVPNFPCYSSIPGSGFSGSWVGGVPGAGGNVQTPGTTVATGGSITQTQLFPPPVRDSNLSKQVQLYLATLQYQLPRVDVDTTAEDATIVLPPPGLNSSTGQSNQNQELIYVKTSADGNTVTITGAASGSVTLSTQWETARFKSNGTNWIKA